jgi:hypothetical protein
MPTLRDGYRMVDAQTWAWDYLRGVSKSRNATEVVDGCLMGFLIESYDSMSIERIPGYVTPPRPCHTDQKKKRRVDVEIAHLERKLADLHKQRKRLDSRK